MAESPNNQNGGFASFLPLMISTAVIVLSVIAGFWSLADPRGDLRDIRTSYLSLREHEEFVARFNKDITRLEAENLHQSAEFQTLLSARQSKEAADTVASGLDIRIRDLAAEIKELRNTMVPQKQFDAHKHEQEVQLTEIRKQLDLAIDAIHMHFEKDADRFSAQKKP